MDTAVRERTRVAPNGRTGERLPRVEPTMTRAARKERAARRRTVPEAWRFHLEDLYHYQPEYPYDPLHEYEWDWTTDPDYGIEGIHLCRFDEDGVGLVADPRAREIQRNANHTTFDKLGDCVELETGVHYKAADGVVRWVFPDLMVLPRVQMLGLASGPERALRLHEGDPPPALVLELLSYGGSQRDLDTKMRLYANLGVREYLVYDLGGKRRSRSPRELLLYRLAEGRTYHQAEPEAKRSVSGPDVHWSDVFNAYIRMQPDPREAFSKLPEEQRPPPRFQWYDTAQGRWRDRETDAEVEREAEQVRHEQEVQESEARGEARGEARTETRLAIDTLHAFLGGELAPRHLERIEATWRRNGPPADAVRRVRDTLHNPAEWRTLLPGEPDNDRSPDWTPPRATPAPADDDGQLARS